MSTYEENRRRLRSRSRSGDPLALDKAGAKYLLNEFVKLFTEGKTPFVSAQDVEKEKNRRASLGLDPDYRDDAVADLLAPQNLEGRDQRIAERLAQLEQSNLPSTNTDSGQGEYQYPRVVAQTEREKETDRMVDLILNLPETKAEADAKVDYEALARENFRRNNPALESMPDEEEFLYNRYKRNLAAELAKQDITPAQARENPEQAFLAGQLERYLADQPKPQSNINRRRGF